MSGFGTGGGFGQGTQQQSFGFGGGGAGFGQQQQQQQQQQQPPPQTMGFGQSPQQQQQQQQHHQPASMGFGQQQQHQNKQQQAPSSSSSGFGGGFGAAPAAAPVGFGAAPFGGGGGGGAGFGQRGPAAPAATAFGRPSGGDASARNDGADGGGGFGGTGGFGASSSSSMSGGGGSGFGGGGFGSSTASGGGGSGATVSFGGFGGSSSSTSTSAGGFGAAAAAERGRSPGGFGGSSTTMTPQPAGGFGQQRRTATGFGGGGGGGGGLAFGSSPTVKAAPPGTTTPGFGSGGGFGGGGASTPASTQGFASAASDPALIAGFGAAAPAAAWEGFGNPSTGGGSSSGGFGASTSSSSPAATPFGPRIPRKGPRKEPGGNDDGDGGMRGGTSSGREASSSSSSSAGGGAAASSSATAGGGDEKLAALRARIQEKQRLLKNKLRGKRGGGGPSDDAGGGDDGRTTTTGRGGAAQSSMSSSSPSGGDNGRDADLAARNALRFASAGDRDRTSSALLPSDLRSSRDDGGSGGRSSPMRRSGGENDDANNDDDDDDDDDDPDVLNLSDAKSLVGTCTSMCPDEELLRREKEGDIQLLEITDPGGLHPKDWTLRDTAVKRFRRSAADFKLDIPELVRPPEVLERVCGYLEEWVMERDRQGPDPRWVRSQQIPHDTPPPLDVYQFVWDRTRMIRKDFILQNYVGTGGNCDARAVRCHERIARWHAMCEHQLSHIHDFAMHQSQQNVAELGQTMKTLNMYYDDALGRSLKEAGNDGGAQGCASDVVMGQSPVDFDGAPLANTARLADISTRILGAAGIKSPTRGTAEPEMRGLYILLTLNNEGGMEVLKYSGRLCVQRPAVFYSKPVQLALSIFQAKKDHNYARFFKLLRSPSTPYLFSCIMFKYVENMRKDALTIMSKTYGAKSKTTGQAFYDEYPLSSLVKLLCYEDEEDARTACRHYGIAVEGDKVLWRHSKFREPRDPDKGHVIPLKPRKMMRTIEAKLGGATRLSVCRGGASGEGATLSESDTGGEDARAEAAGRKAREAAEEAEKNATKLRREAEAEEVAARAREQSSERERLEQLARAEAQKAARRAEMERIERERAEREERALAERRQRREEEARRVAEAEAKAAERAERERREMEAREQRREAARRRAEEEEEARERKRQQLREEAERREEEKARREAAALAEQERREREEEVRRRAEARRRAEEEEERARRLKEEEEEARRLEEEWQEKIERARKVLAWRLWRKHMRRRESLEGSVRCLESIDPTYTHYPASSSLRNKVSSIANHAFHEGFTVRRNDAVEDVLENQMYRLATASRRQIDLSKMVAKALMKFTPHQDMIYPPTVKSNKNIQLFKLAVFLPKRIAGMESLYDTLRTWANSHLGMGQVLSHASNVRAQRSVEARAVAVIGNEDSAGCENCDAALFLLPSGGASFRVEFPEEVERALYGDVPRMALVLDDGKGDDSADSTTERILDRIVGEADRSSADATRPRRGVAAPKMCHVDNAFGKCCETLVDSYFEAASAETRINGRMHPSLARVSLVSLGFLCVQRLFQNLDAEGCFPKPFEDLFSLCENTLNLMVDDLSQVSKEVHRSMQHWPPLEFQGAAKISTPMFFEEQYDLPSNWHFPPMDLKRKVLEVFRTVLNRESFAIIVERFARQLSPSLGQKLLTMLDNDESFSCFAHVVSLLVNGEVSLETFDEETLVYLPVERLSQVIEHAGAYKAPPTLEPLIMDFPSYLYQKDIHTEEEKEIGQSDNIMNETSKCDPIIVKKRKQLDVNEPETPINDRAKRIRSNGPQKETEEQMKSKEFTALLEALS